MSDPEPYSEEWHRQRERERKEWQKKIQDRWADRLDQLFSTGLPQQVRWTNPNRIAETLTEVAKPEDEPHTWLNLPDSGDINLYGVSPHEEEGCVLLETSPERESATLLRPEYLDLNVPNDDRRMAYFWLEAQQLSPSGVYGDRKGRIYEEVCELRPGDYREREVYDRGGTHNPDGSLDPLPSTARTIQRYFEGSFLISCKASPYIQNAPTGRPGPADGIHADMGPDEFRRFMIKVSEQV